LNLLRRVNEFTAAGVYLSEGRHPIIPFFHYSIIPVVSAANLSAFKICQWANMVQKDNIHPWPYKRRTLPGQSPVFSSNDGGIGRRKCVI